MGIVAWVRVILGRWLQALAHQPVSSSAQSVVRVGSRVSASVYDGGDGNIREQGLREPPVAVGTSAPAVLPISLQLQMLSLVSSLIVSGRRLVIPPTLFEEECASLAPTVACCASAAAAAIATESHQQMPMIGRGAARLPPVAGNTSGNGVVVAANAEVISKSIALLEEVQQVSKAERGELGGGTCAGHDGGHCAGVGGIRLSMREARALCDASAVCPERHLESQVINLLASPGALRAASTRGMVEEAHDAQAMITWTLAVAYDLVQIQASPVAKVSVAGPRSVAQPFVWDHRPGADAAMAGDVALSAIILVRILLSHAKLGRNWGNGDVSLMEFGCSTAESVLALAGAAARLPRIRNSQAVSGVATRGVDSDVAALWTVATAAALDVLTTSSGGGITVKEYGSVSEDSEYVIPVDTLRSRPEARFGCQDRLIAVLSRHLRASNLLLPLFSESCHHPSDTLVCKNITSGARVNGFVGMAALEVCVGITASMLAVALSGRRVIAGVAQQADENDSREGINRGKTDRSDDAREEDATARIAVACTQALQIVPRGLEQEPALAAFVDDIRCFLKGFIGKT